MTTFSQRANSQRAPCERACSWASLAPDGELSELEQRLLDSHLARCGPCNRFARQVVAVADELRAAALQPLLRPVEIRTWRRRTLMGRISAVGAAAAVAVMALGIASRPPLSSGERRTLKVQPVLDFSGGQQAEQQALRDLRREALVAELVARNRPARHFGNQPA